MPRAGGGVIALGDVGSHNPEDQRVRRPQLENLLIPGRHDVGTGSVEYIAEEFGTKYNQTGDRAIKNRIAGKVRRAAGDITRVAGTSQVSVYAYG